LDSWGTKTCFIALFVICLVVTLSALGCCMGACYGCIGLLGPGTTPRILAGDRLDKQVAKLLRNQQRFGNIVVLSTIGSVLLSQVY